MNNIDILEEKIKIIESLCTDDCINKETVIKPFKYAISTLIAENKELKEMLKHRIEYTNKLEKDLFQNASNYVIPKSKIKEKIEDILNSENSEGIEKLIELQSLLGKE